MISIDPDSIKPAVKHQDDFFSWNLYRWVRRHSKAIHVYVDGSTGKVVMGAKMRDGYTYSTYLVSMHNRRKGTNIGLCKDRFLSIPIDVTESFWIEYKAHGVRAITDESILRGLWS